jgi:superfamily II DNA/RNA helicase
MVSAEAAETIPIKVTTELIDKLRTIFGSVETNLQDVEHSNKSKLLLQLLKYCISVGDKVLVFSQSIATLDFLENLIKKRYLYFRMDGKTKMNDRPTMLKEFNKPAGGYKVFLISTKAGGVGFNLPGANRVVIYDFAFNPTHEEQAIGRAYRLGQTKAVFVYRFISGGTFEEKMHNTTVFKIQLAHRVVEKKNPKSQATRQKEWFRHAVKPDQEDLTDDIGKDKILDRVIKDMFDEGTSQICGLKTIETLQEESEEIWTAEEEAEVNRMVTDEQKRLEDPDAWRAEMAKRQLAREQAFERGHVAGLASAALAMQASASRMGPPLPVSTYAMPPPTFQARERQAFSGPNGLPFNLSPAAPARGPSDLSHHPSQPAGPETPKATPQPSPGRPETLKATPQPSPVQRKETATPDSSAPAKGTFSLGGTASNGGAKAPENGSPLKAKNGLAGAFSWVGLGKK